MSLEGQPWAAYLKEPPPPPHLSQWRRTPFSALGLGSPQGSGGREEAPGTDGTEMEITLPKGLAAIPLADAAGSLSLKDVISSCLGAAQDDAYRKLDFLNRALARKALFISIPGGFSSPDPLVIDARAASPYSFPRLLISAGARSRISLLLLEGSDAPATSLSFVHFHLAPGSSVNAFAVDDFALSSRRTSFVSASLEGEASLGLAKMILGCGLNKNEVRVDLNGRGASAEMSGALFASESQQADFHSSQIHNAPSTASNLLFNSALRHRARSNYTGLIRIEEKAFESDAYQANHNLLLSDRARADTTPLLEILTDSVRCKHGATAGAVDPEEIFYMQCRGLDPVEAQKTRVMGFFSPVLSKAPVLKDRDIARRLESSLEKRLQ